MKDEYDFSKGVRGAIAPTEGKTPVTILIDDDVLEAARKSAESKGIGYHTLINNLLKEKLIKTKAKDKPIDSAPEKGR